MWVQTRSPTPKKKSEFTMQQESKGGGRQTTGAMRPRASREPPMQLLIHHLPFVARLLVNREVETHPMDVIQAKVLLHTIQQRGQ